MDSIGGEKMSVEYVFWTCLNHTQDEMKCLFKQIALSTSKNVESKDEGEEWIITSDHFQAYSSDPKESIQLFSKYYKMHLRQRVWFLLFRGEGNEAEAAMMKTIGMVMRISNDDCFFLANGDTPIVMRRNGKTVVDDSRWVEREHYPYEALGVDFDWGVIPYD